MSSSSKNKTVVNYLEANSTVSEVFDGNIFLGKKYKDEVTETFTSLFNAGEIEEINKISIDDRGCFIIKVNDNDDITYVNIKKNDIEHYNTFDSMYIMKNKLNQKRIKNLEVFKKIISGALVASTVVAGVSLYAYWFKHNSEKRDAVMNEKARITRENPNINPKDAYDMALQNLGFVVDSENTQTRSN